IHHEHGLTAARKHGVLSWFRAECKRLRDGWKAHREGRPDTERALHVDRRAGLGDDSVNCREAKPGALPDLLCREERLEDSFANLFTHADTSVAHAQGDEMLAARLAYMRG